MENKTKNVQKNGWSIQWLVNTDPGSIYTLGLKNVIFPNDRFQTTKLEEFADNNFKFYENDRKLSKLIKKKH